MTISVVNGHARRAMMTQGNTLQVMCCGYVCEVILLFMTTCVCVCLCVEYLNRVIVYAIVVDQAYD